MREMTLLDEANVVTERLPGCRVEIIGGILTVTWLPDGEHAGTLTDLMRAFWEAGLHDEESRVLQRVGLWLPSGPYDYAIPDLSVVDPGIDEHMVENNCYDPACFRLVVEVTSNNYNQDLQTNVAVYAEAKIPVYVIVDREHARIHVLTDPVAGAYESHEVYAPGHQVPIPESIGAEVTLDATELLKAGARKQTHEA